VTESQPILTPDGALGQWDTSTHIVDFVKAVVKDSNFQYTNTALSDVVSSLGTFVQSLGGPLAAQHSDCDLESKYKSQVQPSLPPLKAAVELLRWAKGYFL
jgi:hypothetical protein